MSSKLLKQFEAIYTKKTKHRKKCKICNKLIDNNEKIVMQKFKIEKYYPVKGLMPFINCNFIHIYCFVKHESNI